MSGEEQRRTREVSLFAAELAAARAHAGLTQDGLAARIHFSASTIAMVETGRRPPSLELARAIDTGLQTSGTFERLYQYVRRVPLPAWFWAWAEIESRATQLRLWEHSLVPGLLQTEAYARAVLATRPDVTPQELDELVAARIERQAVLQRDRPPRLWVVLDEAALHREIGDVGIMHDQLVHLADLADRPGVMIEVVPYSAGAHSGLLGSCAIADTDGRARAVYLETLAEGFVVEEPEAVETAVLTFDTLRAEALPRAASLQRIVGEAEKWT